MKALLRQEVPFLLPLHLTLVDVRDVARALVHVLAHEEGRGRYIVATGAPPHSFKQVAGILKVRDGSYFISSNPPYPVSH